MRSTNRNIMDSKSVFRAKCSQGQTAIECAQNVNRINGSCTGHLVGERHRHDLDGSPRQELREPGILPGIPPTSPFAKHIIWPQANKGDPARLFRAEREQCRLGPPSCSDSKFRDRPLWAGMFRGLARISQRKRRIGAPNQRKLLCRNDFALIRGTPRCRQSVAWNHLILEPWKVAV
jgi:hypothetical protein